MTSFDTASLVRKCTRALSHSWNVYLQCLTVNTLVKSIYWFLEFHEYFLKTNQVSLPPAPSASRIESVPKQRNPVLLAALFI